jgi:hypothetical protein
LLQSPSPSLAPGNFRAFFPPALPHDRIPKNETRIFQLNYNTDKARVSPVDAKHARTSAQAAASPHSATIAEEAVHGGLLLRGRRGYFSCGVLSKRALGLLLPLLMLQILNVARGGNSIH